LKLRFVSPTTTKSEIIENQQQDLPHSHYIFDKDKLLVVNKNNNKQLNSKLE
jgi:hypothetical protein